MTRELSRTGLVKKQTETKNDPRWSRDKFGSRFDDADHYLSQKRRRCCKHATAHLILSHYQKAGDMLSSSIVPKKKTAGISYFSSGGCPGYAPHHPVYNVLKHVHPPFKPTLETNFKLPSANPAFGPGSTKKQSLQKFPRASPHALFPHCAQNGVVTAAPQWLQYLAPMAAASLGG